MTRRLDLWHPSRNRLTRWLDTGEPSGVGDHVERCARCADRLEEIDRLGRPGDAPVAIRQALSALLSPPDDLGERVIHGVEHRARADRELQLVAGLLAIGFETARLMLDDPSGQDRRSELPSQPFTKGDRGTQQEDDE